MWKIHSCISQKVIDKYIVSCYNVYTIREMIKTLYKIIENEKINYKGEILMKIGIIRINFPERKMDYNEVWEIMQKAEILKEIEELAKEVEEKGLEQKLAKVAERLKKEGPSTFSI